MPTKLVDKTPITLLARINGQARELVVIRRDWTLQGFYLCRDAHTGEQLSIHDSQFLTNFGDESSPDSGNDNSTNPPATADSK